MSEAAKCRLLAALACAFAFAAAGTASAQSYPVKPIRLIVPLAPGGGGDLVARAIALKTSETIGQPVVVENRPGGSTIIGTEVVARSAPDGYTLVMATSSHGINPALYKLPFDPVRDFSGVAFIGTSPMMLTVHPAVPARTAKELAAVSKANPGKLNYGSSGIASIVHLSGELFNQSAGVRNVHIPYKGTGPALTDLLGGQIDMMFASPAPTIPHVKSGRLRAIAMASAQRMPALPELPTMNESGFPGFEAGTYFIVLGPAGIPAPVVNRLTTEMLRAAQLPDIRERLLTEGVDIVAGSPQQAIAYIEAEVARWGKVIRSANIKAE
jgi:tripartite-type tricarboxylate transporter receptor subunit TctC